MNQPETGFYYHYKRDPEGPVYANAYEVVGTAWNTESASVQSEDPADFVATEVVLYRPLYETSLAYKNGKRFWVRPREMFTEKINKNGREVERFAKITDPNIITELERIRNKMYGTTQ